MHNWAHSVTSQFMLCQTKRSATSLTEALVPGWASPWTLLKMVRRKGPGTHGLENSLEVLQRSLAPRLSSPPTKAQSPLSWQRAIPGLVVGPSRVSRSQCPRILRGSRCARGCLPFLFPSTCTSIMKVEIKAKWWDCMTDFGSVVLAIIPVGGLWSVKKRSCKNPKASNSWPLFWFKTATTAKSEAFVIRANCVFGTKWAKSVTLGSLAFASRKPRTLGSVHSTDFCSEPFVEAPAVASYNGDRRVAAPRIKRL